jgi:hypothetical protein
MAPLIARQGGEVGGLLCGGDLRSFRATGENAEVVRPKPSVHAPPPIYVFGASAILLFQTWNSSFLVSGVLWVGHKAQRHRGVEPAGRGPGGVLIQVASLIVLQTMEVMLRTSWIMNESFVLSLSGRTGR